MNCSALWWLLASAGAGMALGWLVGWLVGRLADEEAAVTDCNWGNDELQFPRLIAEAERVGAFTPEVMQRLADEMDLEVSQVVSLIDRACDRFDRITGATG